MKTCKEYRELAAQSLSRKMWPIVLGTLVLSLISGASGLLLTIFVVFGLVFELPVVSVLLTGLGLIRAEWLKAGRKIMIVVIFVLAAIITPPDVVSQIMVALPMILLYELSIALSSLVGRRRKDAQDEEEEDA